MKKLLLVIGLSFALPSMVCADTIFGVYAGVRMWQQDYEGDFHLPALDIRPIDVDDDIDLEKNFNPTFYIAVEHFIPFLPNIKLQHTDITSNDDSNVDLYYTYLGRDFPVGTDVETDVDLSYDALVLYYEVLDNWVNLDIGLAIVDFNSDLIIKQKQAGGFVGKTPIDETVPLLYTRTELQLPFTGLSGGAEISMIRYDGHEIMNISAFLAYKLNWGLSATLGYEYTAINLDGLRATVGVGNGSPGTVTPINADLKAKGPFLGLNYHF